MGSLRILLGKARWRRRRAIPSLLPASVDGVGRPTFLYLSDTQRKCREVQRGFVSRRSAACFEPPAQVVSAVLAELVARYGPGRAILSRRALELLVQSVLREHAGPWLRSLGRPEVVARAMADLHQALREHRLPLDAHVPHFHELVAVLRGIDAKVAALPRHVDPAGALGDLLGRLEAPGPGLVRWLRRHHAIVIDDILQPSPLRTQVLIALCRAWAAAGCHVIWSLETGRDLGGREAGVFFDYDDADEAAVPLRPFAATRALRAALFDSLLETGEADLLLATRDGVRAIEPWSPFHAPEAPDVSDLVYGNEPAGSEAVDAFAACVRIRRADDPTAELRGIAAGVKQALLDGVPPEQCVVALPHVASVAPLLRGVLADFGIPYTLASGQALVSLPFVRAIRDGLQPAVDLESAVRLTAAELGYPTSLEGSQLIAWGTLLRLAADVGRDLDIVGVTDPEPRTAALLAGLGEAVFRPEPTGGRVQVVGLLELRGLTPQRVWLGGLDRGRFPAPDTVPWLVPVALHRRLRTVDAVAESRYLLGSLLRNVLDDEAMEQLTLSWAATVQGRPAAPSPLLVDLLAVPTAEGTLADQVAPFDGHTPLSRSDALRAAAAAPGAWLPFLGPTDRQRVDAQQARQRIPHAFTGSLAVRPGLRTTLSVTALETYLRCPARFWYSRVLRLREPDAETLELTPDKRGTALHRILEEFLRARNLRPLQGDDADRAARELHRVACAVLDGVEAEAEGTYAPEVQAHVRHRWLSGLVDDEPAGILRAWLDRELDQDLPLAPAGVEVPFEGLRVGPVTLRGTLDRVDRLPGGDLLVTDYKSGHAPTARAIDKGLSLQAWAYAAAIARDNPGKRVVSNFFPLGDPARQRRTGFAGDPDLLDVVCTPQQRRHAAAEQTEGFQERLDRAASAAEAMLAGHFPTTSEARSDAGCDHCPWLRICGQERVA